MAAEGRVMKISDDVLSVYHSLPDFPYILLRNRYSPGTLLHAPDLKVVAEVGNLTKGKPLKVTPSLEYFAVSQGDADRRHIIRRAADGQTIGSTNSLSSQTLIPNRNPIYFLRDVGLSPILQRLTDSTRPGRNGFDIRKLAYQLGAPAFALFYRDDDFGMTPPPPDLFDLHTGAVLQILPEDAVEAFFDGNGSPYFVLVLRGARWQLRRTDAPDHVIIERKGSPTLVSFGDPVLAGYYLVGFPDATEIRRIDDGGLVDRIDESLREASPLPGGISWRVQMRNGSMVQVLRLENDSLQLHAVTDEGSDVKADQLFVPVDRVPGLEKSPRDRPAPHKADFSEGTFRVTEQDKQLRGSVWRQGQNNRPVYFEDEQPQDLGFLYIRRFYEGRDRDDEDLIRSELRRSSDDSLVFGRNDEIPHYGSDPSRNYVWMQFVEPETDGDSEVVLVRFADGEVIWDGEAEWISFAPFPSADYFFVWSGSGPDQLRNLEDGAEITALGGALYHLDFRMPARDGYFVAAFGDGHYELWDGNGSPTLSRDLGFGLQGYLTLPNGLMLVWYENGNTYVISPAWLASIHGDPGSLLAAELLNSLCNGLFTKSWFDTQAWASRKQSDTRVCMANYQSRGD
jgi:hypothetical protein